MADEGSFRRFLFAFEYEVVHSRHCRPSSGAGHAMHCLKVGFLIQMVDTDGSEAEFICDVCQQRQFLSDSVSAFWFERVKSSSGSNIASLMSGWREKRLRSF